MAEFSMYGPKASPVRLIESDEAQNFQRIAAGQHSALLAQKTAEEMSRAKQIRDAFAGAGGDPKASPSQQLYQSAARLNQLGFVSEGADLLVKGTLAASREAMEEAHRNQAALSRARGFDEIAQAQSRHFGGVSSQADLDAANQEWEMLTGQRSPFAGQPYSPQLKSRVLAQGMRAKDAALFDYDAKKAEETVKAERALADLRAARAEAARAQAALSEARGKHLEKAGGAGAKDVGMPTKEGFSMAARAIFDEFPDISNEDARRLADVVASEALAIRKGQPGLDHATALKRALEAHRNEIQVLEVPEKGLLPAARRAVGVGGTKRQQAYKPTTAAGATDIPEVARKGMVYQNGKRYRLPDGRIGIRKEGGFEIVGE